MSDLYVNIMLPGLDKNYPDVTTFKIPNITRALNDQNPKNFYYIHQPSQNVTTQTSIDTTKLQSDTLYSNLTTNRAFITSTAGNHLAPDLVNMETLTYPIENNQGFSV